MNDVSSRAGRRPEQGGHGPGAREGMTRRGMLKSAGALFAAVAADAAAGGQGIVPAGRSAPAPAQPGPVASLPDKASFAPQPGTYLDNGSRHPVLLGAKANVEGYLSSATVIAPSNGYRPDRSRVRAKFARLVNADADDIAFVPSTTSGEQAVLRGLGLPRAGAHVVTDTLHFFGSLPMYRELELHGVEVTWVRARDGRVHLEDMVRAIRNDTTLVAVSSVSTINGFQHDMKALCEAAHARGAVVYADVIHGAGSVPMDVKDWGVDFACCSAYKFLMADMGLGFMYARPEARKRLRRTEMGYFGLARMATHAYPLDPPGEHVVEHEWLDSASGAFAHGTTSNLVAAELDYSLDYLWQVGVDRIQAHSLSLTTHLKEELKRLGYQLLTPPGTTAPNVACTYPDARKVLRPKLAKAGVTLTLKQNQFRVTTSVFNDHHDIERLLETLGPAES